MTLGSAAGFLQLMSQDDFNSKLFYLCEGIHLNCRQANERGEAELSRFSSAARAPVLALNDRAGGAHRSRSLIRDSVLRSRTRIMTEPDCDRAIIFRNLQS